MNSTVSAQQVSTYLAQISHEMRSPLHSILGFTHLLSESTQSPMHRQWLEHIQDSSQHLLELINDIIDLELLNQKKVKLSEESVDLVELVQLTINGFQPQAIIGQLQLSQSIDENCPRVWRCDPRKLKQVLINLIANAIKFTPPQGQVHVSLSQVSGQLNISVKDTGIGINTDALTQLFTPFFHNATAMNQQGVGIGLAITKRIIELMNGEIWVNSQPEDGCEFILILPLIATAPHKPTATIETIPQLINTTSILLVDDDPLHHEVFHGMVKTLPFLVQSAFSASEALTLFTKQPTQLVLIDYRLTDSDGITLAKQLRHIINHRNETTARIMILSAQAPNEQGWITDAIDAWMTKPIPLADLIHIANDLHTATSKPTSVQTISHTQATNPWQTIDLSPVRLPEYLRALWPEFVSELDKAIHHCQNSLNQRKMTELMTKAHQLKGQCMVFQQQPLIQLIEKLEQDAQSNDFSACQRWLAQATQLISTLGALR